MGEGVVSKTDMTPLFFVSSLPLTGRLTVEKFI